MYIVVDASAMQLHACKFYLPFVFGNFIWTYRVRYRIKEEQNISFICGKFISIINFEDFDLLETCTKTFEIQSQLPAAFSAAAITINTFASVSRKCAHVCMCAPNDTLFDTSVCFFNSKQWTSFGNWARITQKNLLWIKEKKCRIANALNNRARIIRRNSKKWPTRRNCD